MVENSIPVVNVTSSVITVLSGIGLPMKKKKQNKNLKIKSFLHCYRKKYDFEIHILGEDIKKESDNDIFEYTIHKYGDEHSWGGFFLGGGAKIG